MSKLYKTEQESFWAGEFGDSYIERNHGELLLASNLNFFSKILEKTKKINNCIEFGANIGMNLKALKLLNPTIDAYGIEINKEACKELVNQLSINNVFNSSILDFEPKKTWDLVLIKGVLIHINPNVLQDVYGKLIKSTNKYLLIAEYYNPKPVAISYRGHEDRLFKRDFAGEILDLYPQMTLIDYGFSYHRDVNFPQDDISWFLLEKINK